MASATVTLGPLGLLYSRSRKANSPDYAASRYLIAFNYATKIAVGDVVSLTNGKVTLTADGANNPVLGVFAGCLPYLDQNQSGLTGQISFGKQGAWMGAAVASPNDVSCLVIDDPDVLFRVQVSGQYAANWIGSTVTWKAGTNGVPDVNSGISSLYMDGTTVGNANNQFRINEIVPVQPNGAGIGAGLAFSEGGGNNDTVLTNPWVEVSMVKAQSQLG